MESRENELWRLIKYDKDATPEQITAWCQELVDILEAEMIKTREEVARDHEDAAGYHYAILDYIEEHPEERDEIVRIYGDEEWHWHWYEVHLDAVYWIRRPYRHALLQY